MNCHTGTHKVLEFLTLQQVLRIKKKSTFAQILSFHIIMTLSLKKAKQTQVLSKINWAHASKILWLMTLVVPIVVALLTI